MVNPTVPKAEKTSKAMVGNPKFGVCGILSVIDNKKIATKHNVKVRKNNVKARDTADSLIVRPKTSARLRPFNKLRILMIKTANVVVFNPPAVDPEVPPIYIKIIVSIKPA